jgi:hypothetical protein
MKSHLLNLEVIPCFCVTKNGLAYKMAPSTLQKLLNEQPPSE